MSGEKSTLTSSESRKQMLILESELNRALLVKDVQDLTHELHHLKTQVQAMGSLVSSAAELASTFAAVGQAFSRPAQDGGHSGGTSWISKLVTGVKMGASIWSTVRSRFR
jgi:hypothetical protein